MWSKQYKWPINAIPPCLLLVYTSKMRHWILRALRLVPYILCSLEQLWVAWARCWYSIQREKQYMNSFWRIQYSLVWRRNGSTPRLICKIQPTVICLITHIYRFTTECWAKHRDVSVEGENIGFRLIWRKWTTWYLKHFEVPLLDKNFEYF